MSSGIPRQHSGRVLPNPDGYIYVTRGRPGQKSEELVIARVKPKEFKFISSIDGGSPQAPAERKATEKMTPVTARLQ
ncbi:MAG: hypothetical protein IPN76_31820 [Saprospiraceae bacterium]|nr:hypothetical protein [Saprospiraceae bacterium]